MIIVASPRAVTGHLRGLGVEWNEECVRLDKWAGTQNRSKLNLLLLLHYWAMICGDDGVRVRF
jgi:hypothetical protein